MLIKSITTQQDIQDMTVVSRDKGSVVRKTLA